jgi:hypothetical protein
VNHQPIALHTATRHEVATQTAVADLLRTADHRRQAADELQQAGDQLREAAAAGTATATMRYRYAAAEAVCDGLLIADCAVQEVSQ